MTQVSRSLIHVQENAQPAMYHCFMLFIHFLVCVFISTEFSAPPLFFFVKRYVFVKVIYTILQFAVHTHTHVYINIYTFFSFVRQINALQYSQSDQLLPPPQALCLCVLLVLLCCQNWRLVIQSG